MDLTGKTVRKLPKCSLGAQGGVGRREVGNVDPAWLTCLNPVAVCFSVH